MLITIDLAHFLLLKQTTIQEPTTPNPCATTLMSQRYQTVKIQFQYLILLKEPQLFKLRQELFTFWCAISDSQHSAQNHIITVVPSKSATKSAMQLTQHPFGTPCFITGVEWCPLLLLVALGECYLPPTWICSPHQVNIFLPPECFLPTRWTWRGWNRSTPSSHTTGRPDRSNVNLKFHNLIFSPDFSWECLSLYQSYMQKGEEDPTF